jgi:hypothetical protein
VSNRPADQGQLQELVLLEVLPEVLPDLTVVLLRREVILPYAASPVRVRLVPVQLLQVQLHQNSLKPTDDPLSE